MTFYVSLLEGSEVTRVERYGPDETGAEGSVKHASFVLAGQRLQCIDSSVKHDFTFTPAISLQIACADEAELDALFARLAEKGEVFMPSADYGFSRRFAWAQDRFGVSWQLDVAR